MKAGLYLHVPFCRRKCPYCDFYSFPVNTPPVRQYLESLKREIFIRQEEGKGLSFETFYAGGGTPSLLPPSFYEELLGYLDRFFRIELKEATLEANPETLDLPRLKAYRKIFNRLSLGAQSLSEKGLRSLGRKHGVREIKRAFDHARKAGFENISLDLIFAWPGQTLSDLSLEIEEVLKLYPEHLSCYELSLEPGTVFYQRYQNNELSKPPDEEIVSMFFLLWEKLEEKGYQHYEISNYARSGYFCQHNLLYWTQRPYLGLGPGGASFIPPRRSKNIEDYQTYVISLKEGKLPPKEEEILDQETLFREAVVLGLRLLEGISRKDFLKRYGFDLETFYGEEIAKLKNQGLIHWDGQNLRLTRKGLLLANVVAREFV